MTLIIRLRSLLSRAYALTFAAVLITFAFAGVLSWEYHKALVSRGQVQASQFSLLLAEQATRTFEAVDFTLRGLEPLLEGQIEPHDPALETRLRQRSFELGFVQSIRVLDAHGNELQRSSSAALEKNEADQNIIARLSNSPPQAMMIGAIEDSTRSRHPGIRLARRLSKSDGSFDGVIVADVDPDYFSRFFRDLDLVPGSVVRLTEDGGRVILASTLGTARSPAGPVVTNQQDVGTLGRSPEQAITSVHQLEGYPLAIAVSINWDELRSSWFEVVIPVFLVLALVDALSAGIVVLIERSRRERRKAHQRAIVAQKLEAIGHTTATVAHDFRNILAVLSATVRLVRKQGPDEELLGEAEVTIQRGNAMIEQLLAFSRRQDLRIIEANINTLLRQMEGVLSRFAGPGTTLVLDLQESVPLCKVDHTQFDAALMNLISNARDASARGGSIKLATQVILDEHGNKPAFVALEISDNGHGMDDATAKRVFEPFFTTKESGTGLGLAQVYGFIKQIGGDVIIRSAPGAGTTVVLYFPVVSANFEEGKVADKSKTDPFASYQFG